MRFIVALGILALHLSVQAVAQPVGTLEQSVDGAGILPAPERAEQVDRQHRESVERTYPQRALRRNSDRFEPDNSVRVEGSLTTETFQLAPGHSAEEVFHNAHVFLAEHEAEPLFWCQGRGCGASNLWANRVFGKSMLYGPDDQQSFLLVRLAKPHHNTLLAIYAITRGNRSAYLYGEQIASEQALGELLPTPATLMLELKTTSQLHFSHLPQEPAGPWLSVIAEGLNHDTTVRVTLSGPHAEAWREALAAKGVRAARMELGDTGGEGLCIRYLP